MFLVVIFISFVSCALLTEAILPEENEGIEGLYQGDILLNQQQQVAVTKGILWPGGVVPYTFSPEIAMSEVLVTLIKHALSLWEHVTCIKFTPRTTEEAYLLFTNEKGCFSYVGYQGNRQILSLGQDCWSLGTILHEIGKASNFDMMTPAQMQSWMPLGTPYDIYSIMRFSSYAFTKNNKPTITDINDKVDLWKIGRRDFISALDTQQINIMYSCPGNVVSYSRTICEGDSGSFTCYGGRKIKITYANYGRKVFSKCGIGFNTKCGLPSSFEKVKKTCNGRSTCLLQATDEVFKDSCPLTPKYLTVRYECHS